MKPLAVCDLSAEDRCLFITSPWCHKMIYFWWRQYYVLRYGLWHPVTSASSPVVKIHDGILHVQILVWRLQYCGGNKSMPWRTMFSSVLLEPFYQHWLTLIPARISNHISIKVGGDSIHPLHCCSSGMDKQFTSTLYNRCNYLSMIRFTLNHVSERGPRKRMHPIRPHMCITGCSIIYL